MWSRVTLYWQRFLIVAAFCEMALWSVLVPYLVWKQWSGYLALGLLAWWLVGYWPMTVRSLRQFFIIRREMRRITEAIEDMDDLDSYPMVQLPPPGNIPDGWGDDGPFSNN